MLKKNIIIFISFASILIGRSEPKNTLSESHLNEIDLEINKAIKESKIPGAVLWIEKDNNLYHQKYGKKRLTPTPKSMEKDTIFDAASLTKVMATAPSIMILVEEGKISINDPVTKHLPKFKGVQKNKITIKQLLTHTSGLPPVLPLKPEWKGYEQAINLCYSAEIRTTPGRHFRYSDVNYIILGEIVKHTSGLSLKSFSHKKIFAPLSMKDTGFTPKKTKIQRIAPTTKEKGKLIHGVVHDPTARAMGGVAGHAGLFTTANDLAKFCRMIVNDGFGEDKRILKKQTIEAMTKSQTSMFLHKVRRGLGWDIDSKYSSPRGNGFPKLESFGHTGWTGGSVWIHPKSKSFVILLTNRNHPFERRSIKPLREEIGTLTAKAFKL
tara:strand:+ start:2163 stop:3305 length:1143 start_codon:yes stop_codon:yes gene_type:complete